MNKKEIIKFWKSIHSSTNKTDVINSFQNKLGYGGKRTLVRFVEADSCFIKGISLEEISQKTGWRISRITKLEQWWAEEFPELKQLKPSQEEFIDIQPRVRKNARLYDFTEWYYGKYESNFLRAFDRTFPILVFPAPIVQREDIESVLEDGLDLDSKENLDNIFEQAGNEYLKELPTSDRSLRNDPTYRMLELDTHQKLKMKCALGTYFGALKSGDILDFELLTKFNDKNPAPSQFESFANELILRNRCHSLETSLLRPQGRSAAISISTIIIFRVENGFKTIIKERSRDVAKYPDLLHITPSGMFQPVLHYWKDEFSIKHNIYREYLEELFLQEERTQWELEKPNQPLSHEYFYENENLKYLQRLMSEGEAKLYFTGISINLMNLLPEICTLLLINDTAWFNNHKQGGKVDDLKLNLLGVNWEFKGNKDQQGLLPEGNGIVDLGPEIEIPRGLLTPEKFVPFGAAALYLGIQVAKDALPGGNHDPFKKR